MIFFFIYLEVTVQQVFRVRAQVITSSDADLLMPQYAMPPELPNPAPEPRWQDPRTSFHVQHVAPATIP